MNISLSTNINAPKEKVWQAITDIEHCQDMIKAILNIDIVDKPDDNLIGLKWTETREMFGKEAKETMWITEAQENQYYCTRAESHGSVYLTKMSLYQADEQTRLTMAFSGKAQTLSAKIMSLLMGFMIKGSIKKAVTEDLNDIKAFVEQH